MLQQGSFPVALHDVSFKAFEGRARFLHAASSALPYAVADPDLGLGFSSDRP